MQSFKRAFFDVMIGYFGRRWHLWTVGIGALVFTPLLVFWSEINFNAESFAIEWVKCGVAGILIVFAVEILNHRRVSSTLLFQPKRTLEIRALVPAQGIAQCINKLLRASADHAEVEVARRIRELTIRWTLLWESLDYLSLYQTLDPELGFDLRIIASDLDRNKNSAFLKELTSNLSEFDQERLRELARRTGAAEHKLRVVLDSLRIDPGYGKP